jgi:predicted nucleic acid-binding protein
MILVDSSVWIDYFRGVSTPQVELLDSLLGTEPLAVGDLILAEVLQGFQSDRDFNHAKQLLNSLQMIQIVDTGLAVQAARNYRLLRGHGLTVRKTIDTLIATRCIKSGLVLLHCDRDFDPFATHLGLRVACPGEPAGSA